MPEVDYAILSEWYKWLEDNEDMHIDLIGELQVLLGLETSHPLKFMLFQC